MGCNKMAIEIRSIVIDGNQYEIQFDAIGVIGQFFRSYVYKAEYWFDDKPLSIERVPDSVLVIPFLCNVLPIIWLENDVLCIKKIDKDLRDKLPIIENNGEIIWMYGVAKSHSILNDKENGDIYLVVQNIKETDIDE